MLWRPQGESLADVSSRAAPIQRKDDRTRQRASLGRQCVDIAMRRHSLGLSQLKIRRRMIEVGGNTQLPEQARRGHDIAPHPDQLGIAERCCDRIQCNRDRVPYILLRRTPAKGSPRMRNDLTIHNTEADRWWLEDVQLVAHADEPRAWVSGSGMVTMMHVARAEPVVARFTGGLAEVAFY